MAQNVSSERAVTAEVPLLTRARSVLMVVLLLWLLVSTTLHSALSPAPGVTGIDFKCFYLASERLAHGKPLYLPLSDGMVGTYPYVYSPVLAVALLPLTHLSFQHALALWDVFMALCLIGSVALFMKAADCGVRDMTLVGAILLVSFRSWPATMNFSLGQANFLLLLGICGIFLADRHDKFYVAAVLIALVSLVKLWLLGIILYLIIRRAWKPAVFSVLLYAAIVCIAFTVVGWREWTNFHEVTSAIASQQFGQLGSMQSISGFARVHFSVNEQVQPLIDSALARRVFVLASFAGIFAGLLTLWKNPPQNSPYLKRLQLGLVILSVILMLPMAEMEYYVFALPLIWGLLMVDSRTVGRTRLIAFYGAILVYLLFTRNWDPPSVLSMAFSRPKSLLVSVYFLGGAALWCLGLAAI